MARVFIDGFESGGFGQWTNSGGGSVSANVIPGFSATYSLFVSPINIFSKTLSASKSGLYFSFRIYWTGSTSALLALYDSANTEIASLHIDDRSGKIKFVLGQSGGVVIATGTQVLSQSRAYLIGVKYIPLNSGGTMQVTVDGGLDLDYSGGVLDTTAGLENVQKWLLGYDGGYAGDYIYYDDFVVDDAAAPGNSRIQAILPNAVYGAYEDWTPTTAVDNYTCVDERPASDTDYVSSNTNDHLDLYECSNLAGTIDTVKSVQLEARCAYEGSPTPTRIQLAMWSSSTSYFSASLATPSAFGAPVVNIWETDPAGSSWTEAKVNALKIGVKAVSS